MGVDGEYRALVVLRSAGCALGPLLFAAADLSAQTCRVALILALDVSSSVDDGEYRLQRDGLASALRHPEVIAAATSGPPIALAAFEWSGRNQQVVILPWTLVDTAEDLEVAARIIAAARRSYDEFPTAMGYALGFAATFLREAPTCDRQVIDMSADGVNNEGFPPSLAYRHFPFTGVTVNGLAITGDSPGLVDYFRFAVLHGPGAFVEEARGYPDFADGMRRKLIRELSAQVVGALDEP